MRRFLKQEHVLDDPDGVGNRNSTAAICVTAAQSFRGRSVSEDVPNNEYGVTDSQVAVIVGVTGDAWSSEELPKSLLDVIIWRSDASDSRLNGRTLQVIVVRSTIGTSA